MKKIDNSHLVTLVQKVTDQIRKENEDQAQYDPLLYSAMDTLRTKILRSQELCTSILQRDDMPDECTELAKLVMSLFGDVSFS